MASFAWKKGTLGVESFFEDVKDCYMKWKYLLLDENLVESLVSLNIIFILYNIFIFVG